ncbi:putative ankyrin repeat-containing protein, partial [Delitschia confertaspora ATCC 74209]
MSGAVIPTGGGQFQQSGQLDWVALSKLPFSFGLDVLVRLSKAEVDPATIAIGLIACSSFKINTEAQRRISDALSSLKSFQSYGKLVWFGFGIKPIIKDLADSEHGMACVALCACMSISYDSFFAAGVLRELCKLRRTPSDLLPSIHQWKALIEVCAGSVSNSKFPILHQGLIRCVLPNAETSLHKPTSTDALAKAVGALADVSNGKLENVTIAGGLDCLWLAAIAEWLLSLRIEIRLSSGFTVYKSLRYDDNLLPEVTIIFIQDNEQSIHLSKCYVVPAGTKFWNSPSPEQHTFRGGRSEWRSILSDTFSPSFDSLVQADTRQEFALLLLHTSHLTETCYRYGSMQGNAQQGLAKYSGPFRRFHFSHSSSRGQAFLAFAVQQLPELATTLDTVSQLGTWSQMNTNLEECIDNLTLKCVCRWCRSEALAHDYDSQPFCLKLMVETIIMFLWMLSATEADPSLKPSSCGLRLLYMKHRRKSQLEKHIRSKRGSRKQTLPANWARSDIDILNAALIIFSGSDDTGPMEDEESSAVSRDGVCAFFRALEGLDLLPEEASTVKVVPGYIDFEGTKYGRISDPVNDTEIPKSDFGPHPDYKLIVQETRQPGVITAAYKLSSNIGPYEHILGISTLEKAIVKSLRSPIQCKGLCGQRLPCGAPEAISFVPHSTTWEGNLSHLSERSLPFLRQWSVISTQSLGNKEAIELRVVQAVIYRLYLEIALRNHSCHLVYLGVCRVCASTFLGPQKYIKKAASLSSKVFSHNGPLSTISVSVPSETGTWEESRFDIAVITRSDNDRQGIPIIEAHNDRKSLLKSKGYENEYRKSVLSTAAILGREGLLQLLLEGGAIVHSTKIRDETALHCAAENGENEMVKLLLGRGFKLEVKDEHGLTPLSRAARRGFKSTVKLLIRYGAKLTSRDNKGQTPLVWAVLGGHLEVIERLLQEKADVNAAAGYNGRTALQAAAEGGHLAVVERLL